jgi:glyoxylase-like metal-dependent hydrolase (beta-lactamase superfamily II)
VPPSALPPAVPGLTRLGVQRVPVPVPFAEAGGPANVYVIEEEGGGLALFDSGIATRDGETALLAGFAELGRSLKEVRRIFVSHGHIDHYGYAKAAQEVSGAAVYAHPRDHSKLTWSDRTPAHKQRYRAWLAKLGAPDNLLDDVNAAWELNERMARPVENVQAITDGERLHFSRFTAEVRHFPGHTPGLVCLWDEEHKVLFSDDHLLELISPNPLIDLEGQAEPTHRALAEYLRSAARARALPAELVAPGHGAPFSGHVALIDRLLGFYAQRQQKMVALLGQHGKLTPYQLAPLVFPRVKRSQMFLVLSEVVGNLEVLEDQGKVTRSQRGGEWVFAV